MNGKNGTPEQIPARDLLFYDGSARSGDLLVVPEDRWDFTGHLEILAFRNLTKRLECNIFNGPAATIFEKIDTNPGYVLLRYLEEGPKFFYIEW